MKTFIVSLTLSLLSTLLPLTSIDALAQTRIRVAAPDLSAGPTHSAGGQIDVLYANKLLEAEFAKDNVKVEWYFFKGAGPAINEGFANNQIDFALLGDLPSIIGRASGLPTRLLLATGRGGKGYLAVVPGSGIKTVADLKGKKVGVLRGTADQLAFGNALATAGLTERDVRVINLDFNAVNAALATKQIDATWASSRVLSLRDRGLIEIPVSSPDLRGAGSYTGALLATQSFLQANPELATRVVKVFLQASDWLSKEENRSKQSQLFAKQSSYPTAIFTETLEGSDLSFVYSPLFDKYFSDTFVRNIALAKQYGLIRRDIDFAAWVDRQYLDHALQQLGWQSRWTPRDNYISKQ